MTHTVGSIVGKHDRQAQHCHGLHVPVASPGRIALAVVNWWQKLLTSEAAGQPVSTLCGFSTAASSAADSRGSIAG
jgi:hypothetical protein